MAFISYAFTALPLTALSARFETRARSIKKGQHLWTEASLDDIEMNKTRGRSQINSLLSNSLSWMQTTSAGQSMAWWARACAPLTQTTQVLHGPRCYRQVKATSVCLDRWRGSRRSVWNIKLGHARLTCGAHRLSLEETDGKKREIVLFLKMTRRAPRPLPPPVPDGKHRRH